MKVYFVETIDTDALKGVAENEKNAEGQECSG
jgi:hypothetical protein